MISKIIEEIHETHHLKFDNLQDFLKKEFDDCRKKILVEKNVDEFENFPNFCLKSFEASITKCSVLK